MQPQVPVVGNSSMRLHVAQKSRVWVGMSIWLLQTELVNKSSLADWGSPFPDSDEVFWKVAQVVNYFEQVAKL